MGFVFSGMTGGFLVSPFLAGIVYAKAGYFPVFILVSSQPSPAISSSE